MKDAIQLSIEGGYKHPNPVNYLDAELAMTYLDKDFWQALGKELGWGLILEKDGEKILDEDRKKSTESENAHRFFDLVLTNGDLDTFWNELSIN